MECYHIFLGLARIALGLTFLWAFLDKVFGLGFATESAKSWLNGGSPTLGFLKFGSHGPFAGVFQAMAGNPIVDWLFMMGLLLIGVSLVLGIGMKVAGYSGALLMLLMWSAVLPPKQNPVLDEHIIYLLLFLSFTQMPVGHWLGLGEWWSQTEIVKAYPFLK
jgi:thiosulfate dehydrogenase [quinone] large subunit